MYSCFYQHWEEAGGPAHESQLKGDVSLSEGAPSQRRGADHLPKARCAPCGCLSRLPAPLYSVLCLSTRAAPCPRSGRPEPLSHPQEALLPLPRDGGAQSSSKAVSPSPATLDGVLHRQGLPSEKCRVRTKWGFGARRSPLPWLSSISRPGAALSARTRTDVSGPGAGGSAGAGVCSSAAAFGCEHHLTGSPAAVRGPFRRKPHHRLWTCPYTSQHRTRRGCQKGSGSRSPHLPNREASAAELYLHTVLR